MTLMTKTMLAAACALGMATAASAQSAIVPLAPTPQGMPTPAGSGAASQAGSGGTVLLLGAVGAPGVDQGAARRAGALVSLTLPSTTTTTTTTGP